MGLLLFLIPVCHPTKDCCAQNGLCAIFLFLCKLLIRYTIDSQFPVGHRADRRCDLDGEATCAAV